MRRIKRQTQTNKNAIISSRFDRSGKARTETQRRDRKAINMAISTNEHMNSTRLFIDGIFVNDGTLSLNGYEARTLYRVLRKHYGFTGKSRTA